MNRRENKKMAQNYECALLLKPSLTDEQVQGWLTQFSKFITDRQGEVVQAQVWGKRRLEFPIGGEKEAIYTFIYFRMETAGDLVVEFERQVRINEVLLREMTVQVPELKVCGMPSGDSRFSESARLAQAGGRRGSGARREYAPRTPVAEAAPAAEASAEAPAAAAEVPAAEAPTENA